MQLTAASAIGEWPTHLHLPCSTAVHHHIMALLCALPPISIFIANCPVILSRLYGVMTCLSAVDMLMYACSRAVHVGVGRPWQQIMSVVVVSLSS
jgi:hypothetical protein